MLTAEIAVRLLKELVKHVDSMLLIVIDGLQWLDGVSTSHCLNDLLLALTDAGADRHQMSSEMAPLVRLLFTTTGRSQALLDVLEVGVYLLADEGEHGTRRDSGGTLAW